MTAWAFDALRRGGRRMVLRRVDGRGGEVGYTLQEALGQMGLNDMVGRVQDAITGGSFPLTQHSRPD